MDLMKSEPTSTTKPQRKKQDKLEKKTKNTKNKATKSNGCKKVTKIMGLLQLHTFQHNAGGTSRPASLLPKIEMQHF